MRMKCTSASGLRRNPEKGEYGRARRGGASTGAWRLAQTGHSVLDCPPMSSEDDDPPPQAPANTPGTWENVPGPVVDLCQSLSDFVEAALGIRPDFTPETLPLVDHYVTEARMNLEGRPEVLDLVAQGVGAYFGEVVRRHLAGFWHVPSPNHHDWLLCGESAYFAINPIGVGYETVTGRPDHDGPSPAIKLANEDREAVHAKLANLPPVPESEYYSLSARLEVLETVVDVVLALSQDRGYGETTYDARDYLVNVGIQYLS